MLRVLSSAALAAEERLCKSMFSDRARQFINRLNWPLPTHEEAYEIDQYDGHGTTYIVEERSGRHAGSLRVRTPSSGIMTEDVFPDLWHQSSGRLQRALEVTRICVCPDLDPASRTDVVCSLLLGLFDLAQSQGASSVFGVVFPSVGKVIRAAGWYGNVIALQVTSNQTLMLMEWHIHDTVPAEIKSRARRKLTARARCREHMDRLPCSTVSAHPADASQFAEVVAG